MAEPVQLVENLTTEQAPMPPEESKPPAWTAAQVQAVDEVFASNPEANAVAGLVGLWGSTLLLHDLAVEHLGKPETQPEPKKPHRTDPEPEE